jgi:hypothetical protein
MTKMKMFLFEAFVGILVILTVNSVKAQVGAHYTICPAGQMNICYIQLAEGIKLATDGRGHVIRTHEECGRSSITVQYGCKPVTEDDINRAEAEECAALVAQGLPYYWSERRQECLERRESRDSDPVSPPPAQNPHPQQPQVVIVGQDCPQCPSLPPPQGGGCTPDEVGRITAELSRIEHNRLVLTEDACLAQATGLYTESVRCGGEVMARASALVTACDQPEPTPQVVGPVTPPVTAEPTPPPPADPENPLVPPPAPPSENEDESWCSENPGICTVIIVGAVLGATALGVGLYEALKPAPEVSIDHDYSALVGVSW